jgi:hypothetical protein
VKRRIKKLIALLADDEVSVRIAADRALRAMPAGRRQPTRSLRAQLWRYA